MRQGMEPHPLEYISLQTSLERIRESSHHAEIISVSHYHFDHVRPGFTNFRYNFSSKEEFQEIFDNKIVLAKDNRDHINASQRRRGYYFERDAKGIVEELQWSDGLSFNFGDTIVTFSPPLPHGPVDTHLGYVVACMIEHDEHRILFVPDVQGPVVGDTLRYILSINAELIIIGGPPIYLDSFKRRHNDTALASLCKLAEMTPTVVVDHHLMRSPIWADWLKPVDRIAKSQGNQLMCMADLAGFQRRSLESQRTDLYASSPPKEEFVNWTKATFEYKIKHKPPLD
jgi:predicted metallo-beta-lactamase superfamily hydrolase